MRKYNFYPGPSSIPTSVLERYKEEILEYEDLGASFIEISHRSKEVLACHDRILTKLRSFFNLNDDYHVLLLTGGAIGQYAGIPMNLTNSKDEEASIAITGHWSKIAASEMQKYCKTTIAVDTYPDCVEVPDVATWEINPNSKFLTFVDNETIHGVEFPSFPIVENIPLVVDQSSNILSRKIDMTNVGVVFACLQKNLGPTGLTVVIVRKDLCHARSDTPRIWDYELQAKNDSMINTPPTFQFRLLEFTLDWIDEQGGLDKLGQQNKDKSQMLYDYIDSSDFYSNNVKTNWRSRMNVPFRLKDESLNDDFVNQAFAADILGIKGHRAVGGMRASIYNAMPVAGVKQLIEFMQEFEKLNA